MKLLIIHFLKRQIFPQPFLEFCKNNSNQPQFLPYEAKVFLKIMDMEDGLYTHVFMILRKDYDNKK